MKKTIEFETLNSYLISFETLLSNIGYKNIKGKLNTDFRAGIVCCIEKGLLEDIPKVFFLLESDLNGKLPILLDVIKNNLSNNTVITIVTSKNKISEYFKNWIVGELPTNRIDFWNNKKLLDYYDAFFPEYWNDKDPIFKHFDEKYNSSVESYDFINILNIDKKYQNYLQEFIEPKIFVTKNKDGRDVKSRISIENISKSSNNFIINGNAGTGKTTLIKQVGKQILKNSLNSNLKTIPIYISTSSIYEFELDLKKYLNNYISSSKSTFDDLIKNYQIKILIDSIDEFTIESKEKILEQLNAFSLNGVKFVLGTRNYQNLINIKNLEDTVIPNLSNFDLNQVRLFISNFFKHDLNKSQDLWMSLKENNVLEKIPTTPLTLSLISILYDEKGQEIPSTLADIYDNFNSYLLGRLTVKNNLNFLTINVKEKILSIYALAIIRDENRKRLKLDEFIKFTIDYFKEQDISINDLMIPDLINNLTDGTGVIFKDENNFINFNHDNFLEYYASLEIFNSEDRANFENEIINNFVEYNWQNVAVFYTGRTKTMSKFLEKLLIKVDSYNTLQQLLLSVSGLGYVLQSLWMTNTDDRKLGVLKALNAIIKVDAEVKRFSLRNHNFFYGITENQIALLNLAWFYNNFNSITLREPLSKAFNELYEQLSSDFTETEKTTIQYQLFAIALVMQNGRNADSKFIEILFEKQNILNNPLFVYLFDKAIKYFELHNGEILRQNYKIESKINKYRERLNYYLKNPAQDTSFTKLELIKPLKKNILITEGKTDALLIDHSFNVLTEGKDPFWSVQSVEIRTEKESGGAAEVAKELKKLSSIDITDKTYIGIFDNDQKGFQEFNGLQDGFSNINSGLKKYHNKNIYALLLPIPDEPEYLNYNQNRQNLKYFEIEHYLPIEFLKENEMVKSLPIPDVYEIKDSKNDFAQKLLDNYDRKIFKNLRYLFDEIDIILKNDNSYLD